MAQHQAVVISSSEDIPVLWRSAVWQWVVIWEKKQQRNLLCKRVYSWSLQLNPGDQRDLKLNWNVTKCEQEGTVLQNRHVLSAIKQTYLPVCNFLLGCLGSLQKGGTLMEEYKGQFCLALLSFSLSDCYWILLQFLPQQQASDWSFLAGLYLRRSGAFISWILPSCCHPPEEEWTTLPPTLPSLCHGVV